MPRPPTEKLKAAGLGMRFTRLSLRGFKSFVEATELQIGPGLTGIVGPNGCGKSNLVEALQWVMGEASARRLRGADMDDVIFAGTATRASRNVANVTLTLDNRDRTAQGEFKTADEIEIDRRIERGKGSVYRVNGREMRARDVQTLFADAASGAHSAALIGQGRIGWLIAAKPAERSQLIEEAAGVAGLHARRHEAQLRLDAAETNLLRLDDLAQGIDGQLERLRKQARQAERYRRVSDQLRHAEALLLFRLWLDRREALAAAERTLIECETRAEATELAMQSAEALVLASRSTLPALRDAAQNDAAAIERCLAARATIDLELARVTQALADGGRRLAQLDQDMAHEGSLAVEAREARVRLAEDERRLVDEGAAETVALRDLAAELDALAGALAEADAAAASSAQRAAAARAARVAAERALAGATDRRSRLERGLGVERRRIEEVDLLAVPDDRLASATQDLATAEAGLDEARVRVEAATAIERAEREALEHARAVRAEAERQRLRLKAEAEGLRAVTPAPKTTAAAPVLDAIRVAPGFEAALAAALGDDLAASLDPTATCHWRLSKGQPPDEPAPDGLERLAPAIAAPPVLALRLSRIFLASDAAAAIASLPRLRPGDRVVTRAGDLLRWDGLVQRAGHRDATAARLVQRNRLAALEDELEAAGHTLAEAAAGEAAARTSWERSTEAERAARARLASLDADLQRNRKTLQALTQQRHDIETKRRVAAEAAQRIEADLRDLDAEIAILRQELRSLPEAATALLEAERTAAECQRLRARDNDRRRAHERLDRNAAMRANRLTAIEAERESWRNREARMEIQLSVLSERRDLVNAELDDLADRPASLADDRAGLERDLAGLRTAHRARAAILETAETDARAADDASRRAAQDHGAAREARGRAQSAVEAARAGVAAAADRARGPFECPAGQLPRVTGVPAEPGPETIAELEAGFDRLRRERDAIGPVNLMAEAEIADLASERETIRAEGADLTEAIARLRRAIGDINREGGGRLAAAFDAMDRHFQLLFTELFGGGEARLQLVPSESDPLSVGLEIMACPPGKRLQVLSLLSGGERALTALALVFAVFLTNPAPICVLDEVDAPLDDANVERFCRLVRRISGETGTRFLVISHHQVTMAEMDRLYGVTMTERGISRLVSVDLARAIEVQAAE